MKYNATTNIVCIHEVIYYIDERENAEPRCVSFLSAWTEWIVVLCITLCQCLNKVSFTHGLDRKKERKRKLITWCFYELRWYMCELQSNSYIGIHWKVHLRCNNRSWLWISQRHRVTIHFFSFTTHTLVFILS